MRNEGWGLGTEGEGLRTDGWGMGTEEWGRGAPSAAVRLGLAWGTREHLAWGTCPREHLAYLQAALARGVEVRGQTV